MGFNGLGISPISGPRPSQPREKFSTAGGSGQGSRAFLMSRIMSLVVTQHVATTAPLGGGSQSQWQLCWVVHKQDGRIERVLTWKAGVLHRRE